MNLLTIRTRMLSIKPEAQCAIYFIDDEKVTLEWIWWEGAFHMHNQHSITIDVRSVKTECRAFEREMHKAKRVIKHGRGAQQ
jgi:hypothetical protein